MQDENEAAGGQGRVRFAAMTAVAITFSCVLIGETAQQFADNVAPIASPPTEPATTASQPRFNAIDYATTAAIKGGTVIIGPCDAQKTGR